MRVMVTGAGGFIGSRVVDRLVRRGDEVTAFDLPDALATVPHRGRVAVVPGSFDHHDAIARATAGADVVVHAGGLLPANPPHALRRVNVEGTRSVAAGAARAGVPRFVYLSSTAVYPDVPPAEWPIAEDHWLDPPAAADAYGRSKIDAEDELRQIAVRSGMEPVVLRPPTAYGRGAPFAPVLVRTLLARPPATMPRPLRRWPMQWVHVDDLVGAIVAATDAAPAAGRTLNIAGAELFGLRRLNALLLAALAGLPPPPEAASERTLRFSLRRAAHALGYRPAVPISTGFTDMVAELVPGTTMRPGVWRG